MPEIKLPAMSPTMEEGTLAKWLGKVGDTVKPGDVLAEIETDKATMELEADEGGVVVSLHVEAGVEGVPVGTLIATIRGSGVVSAKSAAAVTISRTSLSISFNAASSAKPRSSKSRLAPSIGSDLSRIAWTSSRLRYLAGSDMLCPR